MRPSRIRSIWRRNFGVFSTNADQIFFAKFMTASRFGGSIFRPTYSSRATFFSQNWHERLPAARSFRRLGFFAAAWSARLFTWLLTTARSSLAGWLEQHLDVHTCASTCEFAVRRKGLTATSFLRIGKETQTVGLAVRNGWPSISFSSPQRSGHVPACATSRP